MHYSIRSWMFMFAALALLGILIQTSVSTSPADTGQKEQPKKGDGMTPQKRAEAMGTMFEKLPEPYLNGCVKSGKLLFTSGFGSKTKGRLGKDLTTQQGYEVAKECAVEILRNVWNRH